MQKIAKCPRCPHTTNLGERVGGKLLVGLGAIALGAKAAKKHPAAMVGLGLLGAMIGHYADTNILPNCPSCQVALRVVDAVV